MPLPLVPHPQLRQLDRLVGTWAVTARGIEGQVRFEWMEGGFFLIQHVDVRQGARVIKAIEYIGFDPVKENLRSHYMDTSGTDFTYFWEIDGEKIRIWLGYRGSENFFEGHFDADGNSYAGYWHWPGGGYRATLKRIA
jgi:hypothetical protein